MYIYNREQGIKCLYYHEFKFSPIFHDINENIFVFFYLTNHEYPLWKGIYNRMRKSYINKKFFKILHLNHTLHQLYISHQCRLLSSGIVQFMSISRITSLPLSQVAIKKATNYLTQNKM